MLEAPVTLEAAIEGADRALYEAKHDGRNKVRVAPPGNPLPPEGAGAGQSFVDRRLARLRRDMIRTVTEPARRAAGGGR